MAIEIKTFNAPQGTCEREVSAEQKEKLAKELAKISASLRKKMKRIDRAEAEAWKKSRHRALFTP